MVLQARFQPHRAQPPHDRTSTRKQPIRGSQLFTLFLPLESCLIICPSKATPERMESATFAIVGAGVFGLSTAFHLRRSHPNAKVFLIDRTRGDRANRGAASSDFNKIIRADYPDPLYMKMAIDAQTSWRTDPVFRPHYHECGMLFAEEIGMGRASFVNYRALGVETRSEILSKEDALARFPVFQDANWSGVKENYFNPQSGWGEADEAVASFFAATCAAGVIFVEATAEKLVLDANGNCTGVVLSEEGGQTREFLADQVILCVGAYTEKFLADTAPERSELQVDGRLIAAAAIQCKATYPPEQEENLSTAPVHFLGMWHTHGSYRHVSAMLPFSALRC